MADKWLGCLAVDGNYSKSRIGMLLMGAIFLGFFIWLIVLSVQINNIDHDENKEKDIQTLMVIFQGSIDVTRYIHLQPNVEDIYSEIDRQILEKFHDLGLSEGNYSMHWKDEDGHYIEVIDSKDLHYVMKHVSPDTDILLVQMDTSVDKQLVCQCDDRGKQVNNIYGDWCWLRTTPCKLLTNAILPSNRTWARCVYNGVKQIECDGQVECIHDRECRPGTKCSNGCHKGCTCSFQHTCEFYCNDCFKRADLSARCGTCGSLRSSRAISADRNNYSCCDRCQLIPTFSKLWFCNYCDKSSNRSFL